MLRNQLLSLARQLPLLSHLTGRGPVPSFAASFASFSDSKKVGTVKWFNETKGYGFITSKEGDDIFVHQTALHANGFRSLLEGETVEYNLRTDDSGRLSAIDVTGPGGAFVQGTPPPSFRDASGGEGGDRGPRRSKGKRPPADHE